MISSYSFSYEFWLFSSFPATLQIKRLYLCVTKELIKAVYTRSLRASTVLLITILK